MKVKISTTAKIIWPRLCVLCLKPVTVEGFEVAGIEGNVPHCNDCHAKVNRLNKWENSIFTPAAITAIIIGLVVIIVGVIQEGGIGGSAFAFVTGLIIAIFMLFILFYLLFYLALMPFRLIFRSKLAKSGVKVLKSKEPGIIVLKFSNAKYANEFQKVNQLI